MRKPVYRNALFKGYKIVVRAEDEAFYYVGSSGRVLPKDLFPDMSYPGKAEYEGKIPKDSPDLVFLDEA